MNFTDAEREYLRGQPIGRLSTLAPDGSPQTRPVGFEIGPDGTIDIGGYSMAESQKFRNVRRDGRVSFVVDDLASRKPWRVRGVEIRGRAEALFGAGSTRHGNSGDIIRIHPRRILSWGIEEEQAGLVARDVG